MLQHIIANWRKGCCAYACLHQHQNRPICLNLIGAHDIIINSCFNLCKRVMVRQRSITLMQHSFWLLIRLTTAAVYGKSEHDRWLQLFRDNMCSKTFCLLHLYLKTYSACRQNSNCSPITDSMIGCGENNTISQYASAESLHRIDLPRLCRLHFRKGCFCNKLYRDEQFMFVT